MPRFSLAAAAMRAAATAILIASSSAIFGAASDSSGGDSSSATAPATLTEIQVTAQRLNDARSSIESQTGASTYTIDAQAIAAIPGGQNNQLNQADLAYIASNYIHLDHEGRVSASGGVSYLWYGTRFSFDDLFGSGLRQDLTLPDGSVIPNGDHTPSYNQINFGMSHAFKLANSGPLTVRFDVINVADKVYQIRSGTGVGVFAPQYGPRRGFFGGLAWKF